MYLNKLKFKYVGKEELPKQTINENYCSICRQELKFSTFDLNNNNTNKTKYTKYNIHIIYPI